VIVEADQRVAQLDQLLTGVGQFLSDRSVAEIDAAPASGGPAWIVLVEQQLSELRGNAMDLSELRKVDRFGVDPSLANRRAVLLDHIGQVSTFVDMQLVPHLKSMSATLTQAGADAALGQLTELLGQYSGAHRSDEIPAAVGLDPQQVALAGQGIDLLRTSEVPGVLEVLGEFEHDFRTARNQIARMNTYKGLHDQLHHLQFDFFNFLEANAERMRCSVQPAEDEFEDIGRYAERIRDQVVDPSRAIKAGTDLRPFEVSWIDDLERICSTLADGSTRHDMVTISGAVAEMDHLMGPRSEALNRGLVTIAGLLPLDALEQALKRVIELMKSAAAEELLSLEDSLAALVDVHQSLDHLVDQHDTWQDIDRELRDIGALIAYDPSQLSARWPSQNERVLQMCSESTEEWAQKLTQFDIPKLKLLLADPDTDHGRLARVFGDYRMHAGKGFYNLDKALLKACDDLSGLDTPLNNLLGRIQSHSGGPLS